MFPGYYQPPVPAYTPDWDVRRSGLVLRKRVRRHALDLDWALAGGADPAEADELRLRAEQLLLPKGREELARLIDRIVSWVDRGSGGNLRVDRGKPRRVTLRKEKVWATRPLLVELAERLRADRRPSLRAVAMVSVLLRDRGGPLYDRDLDRRLQRAAQASLALFERQDAYVER